MQEHTKIYLNYFEIVYDIQTGFIDFVPCSIHGEKCLNRAVDIHHIFARGAGGNPNKDKNVITNLIAACRVCHDEAEAGTHSKERLQNIQSAKMIRFLEKKINKIMETILLKIENFFVVYGKPFHTINCTYYKIDLSPGTFAVLNKKTNSIVKMLGSNTFNHKTGFNARIIKEYYSARENKLICSPEDLKALYDEINLSV